MTTVRDKRVIVTGGANGIGFQYCHYLLSNGAKTVAILDLPGANGDTSAKKLNEVFGNKRAIFFPSDVTKYEEFEVAFQKAVKALGGLDILINNAGILNDAHWEKEIQINFTSLVKSTLLGYEAMDKHRGGNGGVIVNVASILGLVPMGFLPVYTATKHAVIGFTVSLKSHYEKTGISVRVMCPGVTETPLIYAAQNKFLNFIDPDQAFKILDGFPRQSADNVGKAMVQLIEKGTNGSVWVSQLGEPPVDVKLAEYKVVKL